MHCVTNANLTWGTLIACCSTAMASLRPQAVRPTMLQRIAAWAQLSVHTHNVCMPMGPCGWFGPRDLIRAPRM